MTGLTSRRISFTTPKMCDDFVNTCDVNTALFQFCLKFATLDGNISVKRVFRQLHVIEGHLVPPQKCKKKKKKTISDLSSIPSVIKHYHTVRLVNINAFGII